MREENREFTFSLEEELLLMIIFRMNSIACFWDRVRPICFSDQWLGKCYFRSSIWWYINDILSIKKIVIKIVIMFV